MAIFYVNKDASGANDGTSWVNAYTDLQDALGVATANDEIWVAEGTYKPTNDGDRDISFFIPSGVEVYGGFVGGESNREQRDWINNVTILSGNIGSENIQTDNSYNVVDIENTTNSTILDGFTVSDGYANGNSSTRFVGAGIIAADEANATLKNLIITNNVASSDGGGLYLSGFSNPDLFNVTFSNNFSNRNGGAIFGELGSISIENGLFINNESQIGGALYFQGIRFEGNIINSTFYNNQANQLSAIAILHGGGGSGTSTADVENSIVWNNSDDNNQIGVIGRGIITVNNSIVEGGYNGPGTNIIDADPLFFDPSNNDLRLRSNSPAVDAGNNNVVDADTDIFGNPRIFNNTVDLGANEYSVLMSIGDVTIAEGDNGTTNAEFNVTLLTSLDTNAPEEITVNYRTVQDTATENEDYVATEGTLAFTIGETSKTITVPVVGEEIIESNERFFVELGDVTGRVSVVDNRGVGTITDDDEQKEISISDSTINEGDEGEQTIEFTVSLDSSSVNNITVDFDLAENIAIPGEDYTDINGTVTFEPGETEKTISVSVLSDTDFEGDETFFVQLSNPSNNAVIQDDQAIGTIANDDEPPLNTTVNRFQNEDVPGTYLFASEGESQGIRDNFGNFKEEGTAFKVSSEPGENLIPLYRFQSIPNPGTYLFVGEDERINVKENFSQDFAEEGLSFYVYGAGSGLGTIFYRFQNTDRPGTYIFVGAEEKEGIVRNFPNFVEEGIAFEVGVS